MRNTRSATETERSSEFKKLSEYKLPESESGGRTAYGKFISASVVGFDYLDRRQQAYYLKGSELLLND